MTTTTAGTRNGENVARGGDGTPLEALGRLGVIVLWWFGIVFFYNSTVASNMMEGVSVTQPPLKSVHEVVPELITSSEATPGSATTVIPPIDTHFIQAERSSRGHIRVVEIRARHAEMPPSREYAERAHALAAKEPSVAAISELFSNPSVMRRFVLMRHGADGRATSHSFLYRLLYLALWLGAGTTVLAFVLMLIELKGLEHRTLRYATWYSSATLLSVAMVGVVHSVFVALQGGIASSPAGTISAAVVPFVFVQAFLASRGERWWKKTMNYLPVGVFVFGHMLAHYYAADAFDTFSRFSIAAVLGYWSVGGYAAALILGALGLKTRASELKLRGSVAAGGST